jgi:hypothetical protein
MVNKNIHDNTVNSDNVRVWLVSPEKRKLIFNSGTQGAQVSLPIGIGTLRMTTGHRLTGYVRRLGGGSEHRLKGLSNEN